MGLLAACIAGIRKAFQGLSASVRRFNENMHDRYKPARLAAVATAILAIGMIFQLFVPPYMGWSNDGSLDSVLADAGLSRMDPEDKESYFSYYERTYVISPQPDAPGTTPWLLKTVIRTAVMLDTLFTRDLVFDMRFLALIYGIAYLSAAFLLLRALLERMQVYSEGVAIALVSVLIMGDTALVTRFASLYTQPLEWILLIGIVDAVFAIAKKSGRGFGPAAMCLLVVMLMGINRYMALAGLVFSMTCWRLTGLKVGGGRRTVFALMAVVLTVLSMMQIARLTAEQTPERKFNQMTRGVLFQAKDPERALAEFGIEPRYSLLTDTYADQMFPVARTDSCVLQEGFFDRYDTKRICVYYLRHPMSLLGLFDIGIQNSFASRPDYSGNYEKSTGLPPMAKSPFPALWSTFKEQTAPKTVGSVFILVMIFWLIRRRKRNAADDSVMLSRTLLDVVLVFAAVEMLTVLIMSGDSELMRESFFMGASIDILVMIFLVEMLQKTKVLGQGEER